MSGQDARGSRERGTPGEERRMHIGVDWGTAWSKLVFRDYAARGGERCVVVRHPEAEPANDFRIPSLVAEVENHLVFGWAAFRRVGGDRVSWYESLKVRMAFPERFVGQGTPLPAGYDAEDMCILYVAYLLQRAEREVARYAEDVGVRARTSFTMGVPMSQLDHVDLGERFLRIGRCAWRLTRESGLDLRAGVAVHEGLAAVKSAKAVVDASPKVDPQHWVRAEGAAALLWAFNSPAVPPGRYCVVDVGAGTTSVGWFQISESPTQNNGRPFAKAGMAFFGAACEPPGIDAVDDILTRATGQARPLVGIRRRENAAIASLSQDDAGKVASVCDMMVKVNERAFARAYAKEPRQTAWYKIQLFLIGGGSQVDCVRERLGRRAWAHLDWDPPVMDPGTPADLYEVDGTPHEGEAAFLLVAYGLSFFAADIPTIVNPADITPFIAAPPPAAMDFGGMYDK